MWRAMGWTTGGQGYALDSDFIIHGRYCTDSATSYTYISQSKEHTDGQ